MKGGSSTSAAAGRHALSSSTQTALLVLVSCLSTSFVATRMMQTSRMHWALLKDLDEADRATGGRGDLGYAPPLTGRPRLLDDALDTVSMRGAAGAGDRAPQLRGQIDGVAR
jgi:hypothetical protein